MKIKNLNQLIIAAQQKRSVFCKDWHRAFPAAWVQNWQGFRLYHAFKTGMEIYHPSKNKGEK